MEKDHSKWKYRAPANLHLVADPSVGPEFHHGCNCCHFLGRYVQEELAMDLYVHSDGPRSTVIARTSSTAEDYLSGLPGAYGSIPGLAQARIRAQKLGLLDYDVHEALLYVKERDHEVYAELVAAVPFTLEYQAVLAYEAQDTLRHQGLMRHLQQVSGLTLVLSRIARLVIVYRRLSFVQAMDLAVGMGEFLLQELLATEKGTSKRTTILSEDLPCHQL